MRTFARALMCGLFAMTLGAAACGDDDKDAATDTAAPDTAVDTGGGEVAPDTTAPDTTAPDTTAPDTSVPDTTVPETVEPDTAVADTAPGDTAAGGACTNAGDLAIIQSGDKDPGAKAADCGGTSCIAKLFESIDAFEACVQTCMDNPDLPNHSFVVSAACSSCYVKSVRCTAEFCGLNDPNKSCVPASFGGKGSDSADCNECRADNGCTSSFYTCSGLTPPPG